MPKASYVAEYHLFFRAAILWPATRQGFFPHTMQHSRI